MFKLGLDLYAICRYDPCMYYIHMYNINVISIVEIYFIYIHNIESNKINHIFLQFDLNISSKIVSNCAVSNEFGIFTIFVVSTDFGILDIFICIVYYSEIHTLLFSKSTVQSTLLM